MRESRFIFSSLLVLLVAALALPAGAGAQGIEAKVSVAGPPTPSS